MPDTARTSQHARKRDAAATADSIITAARNLFGARGYDAVGTREIAQMAGVNVALINRYFGSKAGLFAAAVPPTLTLEGMLDGPRSQFGARIAAMMAAKTRAEGYDSVVALVSSATNPEAAPLLRAALETQVISPLADWLGGENAQTRALLIATQIAGLSLWIKALGAMDGDTKGRLQMQPVLAGLLQDLVDGKSP